LDLVKAVGEVTAYEQSDDAEENLAAQEAALDRAKAFRKEYRRTMKDYLKASEAAEEQFGDTAEQFIEAERKYYLQKAKVDLITELVQATKKAAAEAQAEVDRARLGGELSKRDQKDLLAKIEKYQGATNAAGEIDQDAVDSLLRTLEEELEFDKDQWAKKLEKLGDKAKDNQKRKYFAALARYNFVSLELGDNSPAKAAARAAAVAAAAEA
jgi:hypothetical protein